MNLSVWTAVDDYYRALWIDCSLSKLSSALDDDVQAKNHGFSALSSGDSVLSGKEAVLKLYKETFFDTVCKESTRLYNFTMDVSGANGARVSFSVKDHHRDQRQTRVGKYIQRFTISPETGKIICIDMVLASSRDSSITTVNE